MDGLEKRGGISMASLPPPPPPILPPPLTGISTDAFTPGVEGDNDASNRGGAGVLGVSNSFGVQGITRPTSLPPPAVGVGVFGDAKNGIGVFGQSENGEGVHGESANFDGVVGISRSPQHAGLSVRNDSGGLGI